MKVLNPSKETIAWKPSLVALALLISAPLANAASLSDQLTWQIRLPADLGGRIDTCDVGLTEAQEAAGVFTIQCSFTNLISPVGFYPAFNRNVHVLEPDGSVSDLISARNTITIQGGEQTNNIVVLLTSDGDPGGGLRAEPGSIELGPEYDDGQLHELVGILGLADTNIISIKFMSDCSAGEQGPGGRDAGAHQDDAACPAIVPEPGTAALLTAGLLGFLGLGLGRSSPRNREPGS